MKKTMLGFSIVAVCALSACSAKIESSGGPAPEPVIKPQVKTELEGLWTTGCIKFLGDLFLRTDVAFSAENYSTQTGLYSDSACVNKVKSDGTSGSFTIAGASSATPGAKNLNLRDLKGETTFDLFMIENGVLYLGDNPGHSEPARSKSINKSLAFKRK